MDFKGLPLTFLNPLVKQLNTFDLISLLIAIERKHTPKDLKQTQFYIILFNQK